MACPINRPPRMTSPLCRSLPWLCATASSGLAQDWAKSVGVWLVPISDHVLCCNQTLKGKHSTTRQLALCEFSLTHTHDRTSNAL